MVWCVLQTLTRAGQWLAIWVTVHTTAYVSAIFLNFFLFLNIILFGIRSTVGWEGLKDIPISGEGEGENC